MVRISFWTCLFLVLLRIAIGWHFFFEGVHKVQTTDTPKPFSSAGYFREAAGPIGPTMRDLLSIDEDAKALAKLRPSQPPEKGKEEEAMPAGLNADWDGYFNKFTTTYKLSEAEKNDAAEVLKKAKVKYVFWMTKPVPIQNPEDKYDGAPPKQISKTFDSVGKSFDYKLNDNPPARIAEYEQTLAKIRDVYEKELHAFNNTGPSDELRALKVKAATQRAALLKDVDQQGADWKKTLAATIAKKGFDPAALKWSKEGGKEDEPSDQKLLAMITPAPGEGVTADRMPKALGQEWDDYVHFVKEFAPSRPDADQDAAKLQQTKLEYVRFLLDKDPETGADPKNARDRLVTSDDVYIDPDTKKPVDATSMQSRRAAYQQAVEKLTADSSSEDKKKFQEEAQRFRKELLADVQKWTNRLKSDIGVLKPKEQQGTLDEPKESSSFLGISAEKIQHYTGYNPDWTRIEKIDWLTRWTLTIAGAMLLIGFFTRFACFIAAGFLLLTYLSTPSFPWTLPSPTSEGYYVFVNKNVIEFLALMALMTTRSGYWLGVDGVLSLLWPFGRRKEKVATKPTPPAQGRTFANAAPVKRI